MSTAGNGITLGICACLAVCVGCERDAALPNPDTPADQGMGEDRASTAACGDLRGLQANAPWPMPGYCPTHIGRSPNLGPRNPRLRWRAGSQSSSGAGIVESPALSASGTLHGGWAPPVALDVQSGMQRWSYGGGLRSSATIGADGTVYFGSGRGELIAFDGASGGMKWSVDPGTGATASGAGTPVVGGDGTIYFSSGNGGGFHAVDSSGKLKWSEKPRLTGGTPAIGLDGTVYVVVGTSSPDAELCALDPDSGRTKWSYPLAVSALMNSPSIGMDGTLYVAGRDVHAVDPNGMRRWVRELRSSPVTATALAPDGRVIVGAGRSLVGLEGATGEIASQIDLPYDYLRTPTIDGSGRIYVGGKESLYAIDGAPWTMAWSFQVTDLNDDDIGSSAVIGIDRTLFLSSRGDVIYCLGE